MTRTNDSVQVKNNMLSLVRRTRERDPDCFDDKGIKHNCFNSMFTVFVYEVRPEPMNLR